MAGNEFSLPDDLGWECNDELQKCIDVWAVKAIPILELGAVPPGIIKAELIDDMYAIIKKYQQEKNPNATAKTSH